MSASLDYQSAVDLLRICNERNWPIWRVALSRESLQREMDEAELLEKMAAHFRTMCEAVQKGMALKDRSVSGLSGGDANRLRDYANTCSGLTDQRIARLASYGIAVLEYNAQFGRIVATPTAGSSGILPACLLDLQEHEGLDDKAATRALFTAAGIGVVIGNNACFSGARGGCQAEIGSASSMAAAAIAEAKGASPEIACRAAAFALMNTLGMVCDPVGGYVEVPCASRNGMFAVHSLLAAIMALAGVRNAVSLDDVVFAMRDIGRRMPAALKETSQGGLAISPGALHDT